MLDRRPISFFCMWLSSFSNTTYWRDCTSPTEYSRLPCQILVHCPQGGYYQAPNSVPLVYVSILMPVPTLFWLLYLCNIVLNQEVWCFQLCSLSGLLWLFGFFCGSTKISGSFFYFCEKYHWNFDRDCLGSIDGFG